jgi:hypothetical protein
MNKISNSLSNEQIINNSLKTLRKVRRKQQEKINSKPQLPKRLTFPATYGIRYRLQEEEHMHLNTIIVMIKLLNTLKQKNKIKK